MKSMQKISIAAIVLLHTILYLHAVWENSIVANRGRYFLLADDSMISMVYAKNLFDGNGLVWQAGDRVMGITNPLWTMIMSATFFLNLPRNLASLPIIFFNFLLDLWLIFLIYREILKKSGFFSAVFWSALLSISTQLIFFSILGFETTFQALLFTIVLVRHLPDEKGNRKMLIDSPIQTFLLLAVAVLIRPDSGLFFAIFTIAAIVFYFSRTADEKMRKKIPVAIFTGVAIITAMLVAQKLYYGDWLTNTYYLKATGGARSLSVGWKYFRSAIMDENLLVPLILTAIILVRWIFFKKLRRKTRKRGILVASLIFFWLCYVIWTGGDAIPHYRFSLPIIPSMYILAAGGTKFLLDSARLKKLFSRKRITAGNVLSAVALFILLAFASWMSIFILHRQKYPHERMVDRVFVAEELANMRLLQNTKIALFEAGTIPFLLPQFKYHDLLGKNDRYIARTEAHRGMVGHNKWDFDYSLGQIKPDIIITRDNYEGITDRVAKNILKNAKNLPQDAVFFPIALWIHPIFVEKYRKNRLRIETPHNTHWTFKRSDAVITKQ